MEYLDGEVGCSGDPAVGGEQGCVEVSGEDDVDGVVDDQVVSVGSRFGDERLAPADRDREREEPVERRGGSGLIDEFVVEHAADGAGGFDVEVVGYPPGSISWREREEASADGGTHDDLGGSRRVQYDRVHEPLVTRSSSISSAAVVGRSIQSPSDSMSSIQARRASIDASSSGLTTTIEASLPRSSARRAM